MPWPRLRRREPDDFAAEIASHLAMEVDRLVRSGMPRQDAEFAARRAFGNPTSANERFRQSRPFAWTEGLWQDVRFALRGFRRSPAFVATVVLTLALGLGLNTALFTVFNTYILRPAVLRDPGSLYELAWFDHRGGAAKRLTWPQFREVAGLSVAAEAFGYNQTFSHTEATPLVGSLVTGDAFRVMGARIVLGRPLVPEDAAPPSGALVAVLSYDAWRLKFGGDSGIVGRTIRLRGHPVLVVGVAAPKFAGIGAVPPDFWAPITFLSRLQNQPELYGPDEPAAIRSVVRLRPGVSEAQARNAFATWASAATATLPDSLRWTRVELVSLKTPMALSEETIALFAPAAVAFALVMLIACANIANVMLARGVARQREIGVRIALGGSRSRLLRQLLTENVLLALPAAALGFVISRLTLDLTIRVTYLTIPPDIAALVRTLPLAPDTRVFVFVLAASALSAMLFGLMPALQATRSDIVRATRGEVGAAGSAGRARGTLVTAQLAVCSLLLVVAGVLLRGARAATATDPGIRTEDIVQLRLDDSTRITTIEHLREQAQVRSVAAGFRSPLDGFYPSFGFRADGKAAIASAYYDFVDSAWFDVLGVPLLKGRTFTAAEANHADPVAIVNAAAAEQLWPGRNPVGQLVVLAADPPARSPLANVRVARVVGVSANAVPGWIGLGRDRPVVYFAYPTTSAGMRVFARVRGPADAATEPLDRALSTADERAVDDIHPMSSFLATQTWPFRAFFWVSSAVGAIALVLTLIGVYGVLAYLVAQRTREIGIRMALGAGVGGAMSLVVREAGRQALVGIGIGTLLALGAARALGTVLQLVDTTDPVSYILAITTVLVGAVLAAVVPARRAARVDPMEALRAE